MNIRRSSEALSEADADALLSGRALAGHEGLREIIDLMIMASTMPAPTPNAALAAVLDTGFAPLPVDSAQRGSRWGRWGVRIGVATAAAMTVTFGAATANALPSPLQTVVANVVGALTPLQLPRPAARHDNDNGSTDRGGASNDPAGVRGPDSGPDADTRTDAEMDTGVSSGEPAEATPTAPTTGTRTPEAPAAVAPPRRPGATATTPAEPDERDAVEPDSDKPDTNEPDADEPDADNPDTNEPGAPDAVADQPEAPDADAGDVDDQDAPDADEPELDVDGQPQRDTDGDD